MSKAKKRMKLSTIRLPALQCKLGDRGYFIAAMRLGEVAERVKDVAEVHESKKLAEWIQRRIDHKHAGEIADYLTTVEERFFNALVVGVYGGHPQWAPLQVADPRDELTDEDEDRVSRTVGVLVLSGNELLFPIDGQHRVAGIKKAVERKPELAFEEISVILVGHARTELGLKRTRQLFVTLNKRAKKVSDRDIVALDEDNGLAVATRRLIDHYVLFQTEGFVSFAPKVDLNPTDTKAITSVLGLYQIVKGLYPRGSQSWPKFAAVQRARPNDTTLDEMYAYYVRYWEALVDTIPEYGIALIDQKRTSDYYRRGKNNHLLFRPGGQLAFARAVEFLVRKGVEIEEAVEQLYSTNEMKLTDPIWHHVLWHPGNGTMLTNWTAAQTQLLLEAGVDGVTLAAKNRLQRLKTNVQSE